MFKELMPQNEALGTFIDSILMSLGGLGGIVGGVFGFFSWKGRKKFEEKIRGEVDKEIESHKAVLQAKADELSQTLSEKITRRSKAFDLRIKKEFEFYDKFGYYSNSFNGIVNLINRDIMAKNKGIDIDSTIIEHFKAYNKIFHNFHEFTMAYATYLDDDIITCTSAIQTESHKLYDMFCDIAEFIRTDQITDLDENIIDMSKQLLEAITITFRIIKLHIDRYSGMNK